MTGSCVAMASFGYTMMCEQSPPDQLVRDVQMAEAVGFEVALISDHFPGPGSGWGRGRT